MAVIPVQITQLQNLNMFHGHYNVQFSDHGPKGSIFGGVR